MSDIRPDSIEGCIIDITECPICHEVLLDNRCFPCLHTFCLKCLEAYKKKNGKGKTWPCPICRKEFPIPKSVASLSRNFFIDKLIDAHNIKKPEVLSKNCDICSEDTKVVPATRYCSVCVQYMCLSCEKQHGRISATAMHKITSATDSHVKEFTSRQTYCTAHKTKEANVYCQDCRQAICWECRSVSHGNHAIIDINRAAKDLAAKLEEHIEKISEQLRTKQDDVQKLAEREKLYRDEIDAELANICKELNKLYRSITDNGDKLKKTLSASTSDHLNTFQRLRNKVDSDIDRLKKHKVYIEQMIHLGNVSDLCEYTDKLISETARMASENTCEIKVSPVSHLSDLDLQNILIGRRTDIDQQYKGNTNKEQLKRNLHPVTNSKDDNSQEGTRKSGSSYASLSRNMDDKLLSKGSPHGAPKLMTLSRSMSLPRSRFINKNVLQVANETVNARLESDPDKDSSISGDNSALKEVVVSNDKSDRVPQTYSATQKPTHTAAEITPTNYVTNSGEPVKLYQNWSLLRTVNFENGGAVSGITILNSKLYTVFQNRNDIQVYDLTVFGFCNDFVVDELVNPNDITSCNFNKCLYICDWRKSRIYRVDVGEGMEQTSWSIDADLGGLSITPKHNVLLAGFTSNKLKEYTSKGVLIRSISLEVDCKPWHAIELVSSDFVICQGSSKNGFHRVCLIGANGKLKASFGGFKGSDETQLCGPYHLEIDKGGCILVNDCNNSRILLLSQDLKFIKEIIPSSANVLRRARRMYLDEAAGRLYVADNLATGGETKDGRLLNFSIS